MSVVLVTGSHPRHLFMARAAARSGKLTGLVLETREDHVPEPPAALGAATRALFERHFAGRAAAEQRFFAGAAPDDGLAGVDVLRIAREELNGPRVWEFLDRHRPLSCSPTVVTNWSRRPWAAPRGTAGTSTAGCRRGTAASPRISGPVISSNRK